MNTALRLKRLSSESLSPTFSDELYDQILVNELYKKLNIDDICSLSPSLSIF